MNFYPVATQISLDWSNKLSLQYALNHESPYITDILTHRSSWIFWENKIQKQLFAKNGSITFVSMDHWRQQIFILEMGTDSDPSIPIKLVHPQRKLRQ